MNKLYTIEYLESRYQDQLINRMMSLPLTPVVNELTQIVRRWIAGEEDMDAHYAPSECYKPARTKVRHELHNACHRHGFRNTDFVRLVIEKKGIKINCHSLLSTALTYSL